jgi:hypothetical protein
MDKLVENKDETALYYVTFGEGKSKTYWDDKTSNHTSAFYKN